MFPSYSNTLKLGKVICPYDINRNHQSTSAFLVQLGSGLTFIQEKVRSHKHYAISLLFVLLLSAYLVNVLVEWSATVQGSLRENCLANTQTTTQPHDLEKGSCNFWKPLSEEEGKQTETCEAKKIYILLFNTQLISNTFSFQVRNDSSQALAVLMPQLHAKCQEMPTMFRKIDQLEVKF